MVISKTYKDMSELEWNELPILARRIRTLLERNKITANQLCEKTGISSSVMKSYLEKQVDIGAGNLQKLANAFNVSTDYLLGRTKYPSVNASKKAALKYTGLSETALKVLHDLHNAPFEGVALNRHGTSYEISYITLLSKLLEMERDFHQIFQEIAYFMIYSEALPEQAYETRKIKLSSDESERFRIWIEGHKWELIPNDEARELHLQSAGEKFKEIYRKILENETVKGDGRQWQALN